MSYCFSCREEDCRRCLLVYELVEEADIGEGASCHDRIVASARPIRVKLSRSESGKGKEY